MESYKSILTVGGKTNSLGRAQEVIDDVYRKPTRLDELFECIYADDAWVRMRAIDSFEKIARDKPQWIEPYIERILTELTKSSQPSVQWHLAQLFCEVELTDKQRQQAIMWLREKIATVGVDWIVSVNTMKSLVYFYNEGFVAAEQLRELLRIQEEHSSKSVRKKALAFRASIEG